MKWNQVRLPKGQKEKYGLSIHASLNHKISCLFWIYLLLSEYVTNKPLIFAVSAIAFIVIPFLVFILYDQKLARQQNEIISSAKRSNAIVSSLFPSHIREQVISASTAMTQKTMGSKSLKESESALLYSSAPPIAELYPEATVLFAGTLIYFP